MTATAARVAPAERVVRRAELVGLWAVECVRARRAQTDWAAELLGDGEHRHLEATLEADGYRVDCFDVRRVAYQRGTAYVRLFCAVSVRPARLAPELATRSLRGILDELLLVPARTRRTAARLVDVAVVASP